MDFFAYVRAQLAALVAWIGGVALRAADANNVRALANLLGGLTFQGTGTLTLGRQRVEITLEAVVQGTIYVVHGPTVAAVNAYDPTLGGAVPAGLALDTWNVPAATGAGGTYTFPVCLRSAAYRIAYLQGAGAGNVGIGGDGDTSGATGPVLDPRPLDPDQPIAQNLAVAVLGIGTVDLPRPPGSHWYTIHGTLDTGPAVCSISSVSRQRSAAGWLYGWSAVNGNYPAYKRRLSTDCTVLRLDDVGGGAFHADVYWLP